jgi:hypothetical protein
MRLMQPFEFVDASERRWPVPVGTVVDGASIHLFFWSLIGGPFEGLYRGPSVIHDYFCDLRTRKCHEVHQNFHEGMLVAGVKPSLAFLMYKAVDQFGPQWADPKIPDGCEVFDEKYDFDKCARNFARPEVRFPVIDQPALKAFAQELQGNIDTQDMITLQGEIKTMDIR